MDLTRKNWPLGWTPSSDFINGSPSGLLRMDNCHLDEEGALTLAPGYSTIYSGLTGYPHTLFSKTIGSTKYRYAALSDGSILRNSTTIATGGNSSIGAFGATMGYVLACSGSQRKKDNGTNTYNLGLVIPSTAPGIDINNQPEVEVVPSYTVFTLEEGSGLVTAADNVQVNSSSADPTFRAVIRASGTFDTTVSTDALSEDGFFMDVRIGDSTKLLRVRLQFHLDSLTSDSDYYWYEWNHDENSPFNRGINAWSKLKALRGEFNRAGDSLTGWEAITGIKIIFEFNAQVDNNVVGGLKFVGGETGPLYDDYEYMQVNVENNGAYQALSQRSPIASGVTVVHGSTTITPNTVGLTANINEIWIYRRSNSLSLNRPPNAAAKLDQWYRVLQISSPFAATVDSTSDDDALLEGITFNEASLSVQNIPDAILSIVTDFNGRTLYMTFKEVYISELNDPDLVNTLITFRVGGDLTTKNLWIKKIDAGRLVLGTTTDIYEVGGSLIPLPDGTVDIYLRSLGVEHPPISHSAVEAQGAVYYVSSDGIRAVEGVSSVKISPQLDLLFQGHTRFGIAPVLIVPNANHVYPITFAKSKIFVSLTLTDGTRKVFVWDIDNKYWHIYYIDPVSLATEDDDSLIGGFGGGSGNQIIEIYKAGVDLNGDIFIQTVHDDNGQPRNRKDPFTLKITADTGNEPVNVAVAKNGSELYTQVMTGVTFDGRAEKFITIAETIGLGKTFSVKITGSGLTTFKLYNFTIEYDARPEQLTYIRIPYTNLGTSSRKRFVNYPFMIDTLGNQCEFFPLIDGAIFSPSSVFNIDRKGTHIHYFDTEAVGTDIGGIICGFFEFYNVLLDEIYSEKMPVPVTYLRIPHTDYGTPNRKRHSSYKFIINTRGYNVRFTPRLDGVDYTPVTYNTTEKLVVEYFFNNNPIDPIAINIGGVLESIETPDRPFEFYGVITPQHIEVLPPRLKEFRIPENNYGVAAKKRIRTMPMEINTNGSPVTFTPIVDGVEQAATTLTTSTRATTFHYFNFDIFGTDFSGQLRGDNPFEFYGLMKPESVEVLPVGKLFDQIGPIRVDKLAKFQAIRIRLIATTTQALNIKIINEVEATLPNMTANLGEYAFTISVVANRDEVYETILPKTVNGTLFRVEIGPATTPFHRYDIQVKMVQSGMNADPKWVKYA